MSKTVKKLSILGLIAILLVFVGSQAALIINPALADLEIKYQAINPNITHSNILLLSTVVNITMMVAGFVGGTIAGRKIGYKAITVLSCAFVLIGGVIPYFMPGQYVPILLCRALMGVGAGVLQMLGNVLIMKFYKGDVQARMLGIGTAAMNIGAVVIQLLAGAVCTINPNATFLVHAFVAIPLVMILFFMPEPEKEEVSEEATKDANVEKGKVPISVFFMSLGYAVMFMFFYPMLLNCSSILIGEGIGNAATAGTIASCYTAGGIVAGLIFGILAKKTGKFTLPLAMILYIAGSAMATFVHSVPVYMVGAFVCGVAIFIIWPAVMVEFGKNVPADRIGFATGIFTALLNLGAFATAYFVGAVNSITGSADPRMPVRAGFFGIVIVGIIWAIASLVKKDKN